MENPGYSGFQLSPLYPPTTYTSPVADCLVLFLAFLCRTG